MLKVVVFDSGYGGELFADLLEREMPVLEVIRVIAWRNSEALTRNARSARRAAKAALEPYLGQVDLIIFANHLLSLTSLNYFRRKYPHQKFLGLSLEPPANTVKRDYLILTTKAVSKTFRYCHYVFHLRAGSKTLKLDHWPDLIDDGELSPAAIAATLEKEAIFRHQPRDIVLACATFSDIKSELSHYFNQRVKIYDSFDRALKSTCQVLNIRGATGVGRKR